MPEPARFFAGWFLFTVGPGLTLGAHKQAVLSQAQYAGLLDRSHPADAAYVENVLWVRSGVLFVTTWLTSQR